MNFLKSICQSLAGKQKYPKLDSLQREHADEKGGRKPAVNEEQIEQARAMMDNPKLKIKSIIKTLGVSKATLYKYVPMGKSANVNKK